MRIHNKLFLVLFSFSFVLVTALVLLIQWSINKGIIDYVNSKEVENLKPLVTQLENEYKKQNSWKSIKGEHKKFGDLLLLSLQDNVAPTAQQRPPQHPQHRPQGRPPHLNDQDMPAPQRPLDRRPVHDAGFALLDINKIPIAGHFVKEIDYNETAINVNEIQVGWLITPKHKLITDGYELDFLEQQKSYLWLIALFAMLLVGLITLPLAHHLAGPIKKIILGMHKLTQGDYQQQVTLNRKDELGDLSRDFNQLAITLFENENARKRWLANISHELRTPVAILRGELEAMLDGVRQLDKYNIESANDEVKHLQHLIDDLHQLTSADIGGMHYHKKTIDISAWLNAEVDKYAGYLSASHTALVVDIKATDIYVFADTTRLCQLFENLINNCIKYAEASVLNLSLSIQENNGVKKVRIGIEDDGIGVPEQHLTNLFEYLYRVESSRNRKTGGAGLGLSICEHIVLAHQGTIKAEASSLGGLAIIIELPVEG
jgi:two-component system, OmpR family, sensor histidine kinase BaeS